MSNQNDSLSRQELSSELIRFIRIVEAKSEMLIDQHLKPLGLSLSQGYIFGLIADLALKGIAPQQKDLEKDMLRATSSITNLLQGLEKKGLIVRIDSLQDGRAKEIHITSKGWGVRKELGLHVAEWQLALTESLADAELAALVQTLRKLSQD